MMLNKPLMIQTIAAQLENLSAVYLYGSYADGSAHETSDVDIAVLCRHPVTAEALYDLKFALETKLGITVDLIDLLQANTVLVHQVTFIGERLLTLDAHHVDQFEAYQLKEWIWLNEHRQAIVREMMR